VSFLDRLFGRSRETELDPERRSEEYRTADPRDVVETEDGTLMAGPGGTPQDHGPSDHPDAAGLEEPEEQEEPR